MFSSLYIVVFICVISTYVKNFIRHCYNFSHIFNCHTYFKEPNRRILVYLYLNSDLKFNHYLTFVLLWRFQVSIWYNFFLCERLPLAFLLEQFYCWQMVCFPFFFHLRISLLHLYSLRIFLIDIDPEFTIFSFNHFKNVLLFSSISGILKTHWQSFELLFLYK